MKALVVYDGNTEKIAQAICSGMKKGGFTDVECKAAGAVSATDLGGADYWVVGGSSTGFLAGRKIQGLVKKATPANGKHSGAAFDVRPAGATSGMANKLAVLMKSGGVNVVSSTYFSLDAGKALMDGEEGLAAVYGRNLVNALK
jgi:menaquinone-dependent protoporphyrinogen IX oxidase